MIASYQLFKEVLKENIHNVYFPVSAFRHIKIKGFRTPFKKLFCSPSTGRKNE